MQRKISERRNEQHRGEHPVRPKGASGPLPAGRQDESAATGIRGSSPNKKSAQGFAKRDAHKRQGPAYRQRMIRPRAYLGHPLWHPATALLNPWSRARRLARNSILCSNPVPDGRQAAPFPYTARLLRSLGDLIWQAASSVPCSGRTESGAVRRVAAGG
ncbi:hypothetical protein MPH_00173 [Macrophomina phaseolina MS6]|uniref:Uncharacterized protein n=1 Tax=Macrophomina phaseolina (strain MS6) TaxID=1126212 RepID=K2SJ17_MACPH|nr:hypothetical protein MPH_00173 [Macrophomina phaseolina MS6]